MKTHTERPKRKGNGRTIWDALVKAGFIIHEMHYNPNNWGASHTYGWGMWFAAVNPHDGGYFCGIKNDRVYIQQVTAPYRAVYVDTLTPEQVTNLSIT